MRKNADTIIIAHRGGPGDDLLENSLAAFKRAIENGYPVETDIWDKNGELVISHDEPTAEYKYLKLSALLKEAKGKVDLYLELKGDLSASKILEDLNKDYKEHISSVILTSFDKDILRDLRALDKSVRLGLLYRQIDNYFIDLGEELGVDFIGFNWMRVFPNFFNIKQSRETTDLKHYAYTINGKALARVMKSLGIRGLFSDEPDSLV